MFVECVFSTEKNTESILVCNLCVGVQVCKNFTACCENYFFCNRDADIASGIEVIVAFIVLYIVEAFCNNTESIFFIGNVCVDEASACNAKVISKN